MCARKVFCRSRNDAPFLVRTCEASQQWATVCKGRKPYPLRVLGHRESLSAGLCFIGRATRSAVLLSLAATYLLAAKLLPTVAARLDACHPSFVVLLGFLLHANDVALADEAMLVVAVCRGAASCLEGCQLALRWVAPAMSSFLFEGLFAKIAEPRIVRGCQNLDKTSARNAWNRKTRHTLVAARLLTRSVSFSTAEVVSSP